MSKNKDIILKLKNLIELREKTIIANKKSMKEYLVDYKKSLELDKELKREVNSLKEAINLLQYRPLVNEDIDISILRTESELTKKGFIVNDRVFRSLLGVLA